MTAIQKMVVWLDNRDAHSGKMRKSELRYIRTKAHELLAEEKRAEGSLVRTPKNTCPNWFTGAATCCKRKWGEGCPDNTDTNCYLRPEVNHARIR